MIIMKSNKHQVMKLNGRTQAEMFKDIEPGDILQFSIPIEYAGGGYGRGTHASYITIKNLTKGNSSMKSFNQLPGLLKKFELEEIEDNE